MEEINITKHSEWLVPALAVLIIFQTLVLVSSNSVVLKGNLSETVSKSLLPVPTGVVSKASQAVFSFTPSGISLKKGETAKVDLVLTPRKQMRLDGADIILSFDPKMVEVTAVTTPKLFSYVSQQKNKEAEGKVYVTFLEEENDGLTINNGIALLTLSLKGKTVGTSNISLVKSEEGPTTVIAENKTSQKIAFDNEDFQVIVY